MKTMTESNSKEVHIYHASAGTGKTTTLMNIVGEHVEAGVPLTRIAFVTFTRAGADVAKERVCNQFGIPLEQAPHFRTIHSMCFRALGMHKDKMMDEEKYEDFGIKAGYNFGNMGGKRTLDEVDWSNMTDAQLVAFEQLYRANTKHAQQLLEDKVDALAFTRYCTEYIKYKKTFGFRDFTDLLQDYIDNDCVEDVDVAIIDEAQDCSPLQWRVLLKAFRDAKYIYIAGDDKQCIYSFSGSNSSILTHLKGQQHLLDKSYRVPSNILAFVNKHIIPDIQDIVKTDDTTVREGGKVAYISGMNDMPDYSFSKSYFFLARNKKFLKKYVEWAEEHCIPYRLFGVPLWGDKEKQEFRDGKTFDWDKKRVQLARDYFNKGTFYMTPNLDIETIHGVKGDEADVVVLMTDLSKLTWRAYEEDPNDEHKVFYVGCTRAKEELYIMEPQTPKYYSYLL